MEMLIDNPNLIVRAYCQLSDNRQWKWVGRTSLQDVIAFHKWTAAHQDKKASALWKVREILVFPDDPSLGNVLSL